MANIEFLKEKRKELKLTFDELASRSGIPIRTLENIFHGITKNPRIDTMQAIESALGLNRPVQFTEEEKVRGVTTEHKEKLRADETELLDAYRAIKDEKGERAAHAVLTLIKTYLDGT